MLAAQFKRTKIIASVGPATLSLAKIKQLGASGVDCMRLNMSHFDHQMVTKSAHWVRQAAKSLDKPIGLLVDLQGPKIRVGELPAGGVKLEPGQLIQMSYGSDYKVSGIIPIQFDFCTKVRSGEIIFLDDGKIELVVKSVRERVISAMVKAGGTLTSRKGINLPDTNFEGDILTVKDVVDLALAVSHGADFIGLSFVQRPADVLSLKRRLRKLGSEAGIISKIETKLAVQNLEDIIKVSDAIMVARGDLAVEIPPEQVPVVQHLAVSLGQKYQKPVIVATQMLGSMTHASQPTRAEVSDVATAVMQGADAVMLSEETTIGVNPIKAVAMMERIIIQAQGIARPNIASDLSASTQANAISTAAILLARKMEAKIMIAETTSGASARNLASFRPPMPIVMVAHDVRVYHQLAIVWGGRPYLAKNAEGAGETVIRRLQTAGHLKKGDKLVVTAGRRAGVTGATDTIQLRVVS